MYHGAVPMHWPPAPVPGHLRQLLTGPISSADDIHCGTPDADDVALLSVVDSCLDTLRAHLDTQGRFVYGKRLCFERSGCSSLQGLLGKCEYDIEPASLAGKYCSDDAQVLNGSVGNDRLELIIGEHQSGDWFLTSKWPICDLRDRIIGSLGISRHLHKKEGTAVPLRELHAPIGKIALKPGSPITAILPVHLLASLV